MGAPKLVSMCAFAIIVALVVVVGLVSNGVVRHIVQTLPAWLVIVASLRQWPAAKWIALPMFLFWLVIMVLIWLFLLGVARILHGHFTPAEIAMTIVVAVASLVGIIACLRMGSGMSLPAALACFAIVGAVQVGLLFLSAKPMITNDTGFLHWIGH